MNEIACASRECVANLTAEMEGRPMRDFLLGLKWINLLLSLIFEVGRHTSLIWVLRLEDRRIRVLTSARKGSGSNRVSR